MSKYYIYILFLIAPTPVYATSGFEMLYYELEKFEVLFFIPLIVSPVVKAILQRFIFLIFILYVFGILSSILTVFYKYKNIGIISESSENILYVLKRILILIQIPWLLLSFWVVVFVLKNMDTSNAIVFLVSGIASMFLAYFVDIYLQNRVSNRV